MSLGFKSQCVPEYRVLDVAQIERIHLATLELLETVGVKVLHPGALEMLRAAGCRIKPDDIVQIPNWLVEQCIRTAPSRITIYNRLGAEAMRLEGNRKHYGMGTDLVHTYDLDTGEIRQSCLQDVVNAARVADKLPEIDFIGSYALPFDAPMNMGYIDSFKAQVENSIKPIFFTAAGAEDLAVMNALAAAAVGGAEALKEKPFHIHYAEPMTPLCHTVGAVQKLFYCADNGIPVNYTPGMMSGATAPITLAGAITVGNAEALSGLVMHQLRSKGAPLISGFGMSTLDMKTTACIYACPEYRLAISACADLYHYYGVPMWGTAGVSDANCIDQQAGMEWGISLLTAALDGANLIHDVGYLGQGMIGHPAALVICAEIISYTKRLTRGFGIDDSDISMDVIRKVGPQGDFFNIHHTLKGFRKEHWLPELSNRMPLPTWNSFGSPTLLDKAVEKAQAILRDYQPVPLMQGAQETCDALRNDAVKKMQAILFES